MKKKINFNSRTALYKVFKNKKKNNRTKLDSFKTHVSLVLAVIKVLSKTELIDECIHYKDNDKDNDITYTKEVLKTYDVNKLRKIVIMLLQLYDKYNEIVDESPIVKNEDGVSNLSTSNDSNISDISVVSPQPSVGKISFSDSSVTTTTDNVIHSYKRKFSNVYGWKNVSNEENLPTHKKAKVMKGEGFYGLLWNDGKSEQFCSNDREGLKEKIDTLHNENKNEIIFYMSSVESACREVLHHHTNEWNKKIDATISDAESIGSGTDNTGNSIGSNDEESNQDETENSVNDHISTEVSSKNFKNAVAKGRSEDKAETKSKSKFAIGKFKKGNVAAKTVTNKKVMVEIAFSVPFNYCNDNNKLVTIVTINMINGKGEQQLYFHGDYVATYCSNAVDCLEGTNPNFYEAVKNCHFFRRCDQHNKLIQSTGKGQNSGAVYHTYVCVFALKADRKKMTHYFKKDFGSFVIDLFKGFGNFDMVKPDMEDEDMLGNCNELPQLTYNFLLSVKAVKQDNPSPKFVDLVKNNLLQDFQNNLSLETKFDYPVFRYMYSDDVRSTLMHLFGTAGHSRVLKMIETNKDLK